MKCVYHKEKVHADNRRRSPKWMFIVIPLIAVGCSGLPRHQTSIETDELRYEFEQLRMEVNRWLGTPYRLGGTTREGIDCSGFVMVIYRDVFGIQIPRTTEKQVVSGKPVGIKDLDTGDMVFFIPESKKLHMGIYMGHGEFAHASASNGVMVSNMNAPYWKNIFLTARRLFERE